jgi:hypothetical protein
VRFYLQVPPPEPAEDELRLLEEFINANAPAAEAAPKLGMVQSEFNTHRVRQMVYGARKALDYEGCVVRAIYGAGNSTPVVFFEDPRGRFLHVADSRKISPFPILSRTVLAFGLEEATPFVLGVTANPADGAQLVILSGFPSHRSQRFAVRVDVQTLPPEIFASPPTELPWEDHFLQHGVVDDQDPFAQFLNTTVASADLARRLRDPPRFVAGGGVCFVPGADGVCLLGVADSPEGMDIANALPMFGFVAEMSSPEEMDKNWFPAFHVCEEVSCRDDDPRDRRKKRAIAIGRERRTPELADHFARLAVSIAEIEKMTESRHNRFMSVAAVFIDANGPLTDEELADRAGVGIHSVGGILETLREIDPDLFARHPDPRGDQIEAEFADQGEARAREWAEIVEGIRGEGLEWSLFCVRRELAACVFRGETMPTSEDLATRCGRDRDEVAADLRALEKVRFAGFPHPFDARQGELDERFAGNEVWLSRVPLLRQRFPDWTMFRIAREYLAGLVGGEATPTPQQVAKSGGMARKTVRDNERAVQFIAGDLLGADVP